MPDSPDKTPVTIYTDGSCLSNPGGPGGWAAILIHDKTGTRRELSGGMAATTNNRMEITAVLEALKALKRPCLVTLYTDSQYVGNSISKGWIKGWERMGWVDKKTHKPRLNADLWKEMLVQLARHAIKVQWIRGHQGQEENERCDELAKACAMQEGLPLDPGYKAADYEDGTPA